MIEIERGCAARAGPLAVGGAPVHPRRARRLGARKGRRTRAGRLQRRTTTSRSSCRRGRAGQRAASAHRAAAGAAAHLHPAGAGDAAGDQPAVHRRRRAAARRPHRDHRRLHAQLVADDRHRDADRRHRARGDALAELRARRARQARGSRSSAASGPCRHTSRKGWLARFDCYPSNPFTAGRRAIWDVGEAFWRRRGEAPRPLSLRRIADEIVRRFRLGIRRVSDPFTLRLIGSVLAGRTPVAARPGRPPAGLRGRRPRVRLGQPVLRAPARALALRAGADPRHLRAQAVREGQRPTPRSACAAGRRSCSGASPTAGAR